MMLAQHGADVITVETPRTNGGDCRASWAAPTKDTRILAVPARSQRKPLLLNLKTPPANEILWRLVQTPTCSIEGFRPGTQSIPANGFGYDAGQSPK